MLAELRITPVDARTDFAALLASVLRVVHDSALPYSVNAMGTVVEGDLGAILQIVRRCHEEARKHTDRVLIELALDDREGRPNELAHSLDRLREGALGVPLERHVAAQML
jgi:uncharacterized protein YqgV (UPF0045/DUF77 family)